MTKSILVSLLCLATTMAISQTSNDNLNGNLKKMRQYFLAEDYNNFSNYTYPKVLQMMGGKEKMVKATSASMNQMKNEGFSFIDVSFKDPSSFLKKDGELQCSLTQVLLMDTPKGKIQAEYTLIAVSEDDGKNWTFIDASGKSKETMLNYFPNLSGDIIIKPKTQKFLE